jgi:hypothetical protein
MRQGSDPLEPSGSRCWVNGTGGGLYFKCDLLVALFICMCELAGVLAQRETNGINQD